MKIEKISVGALQVNCYILLDENTKKAIVIDPGDDADRIYKKLTNELDVECVAILLTHGHFDHIMGVNGLKGLTGAPVWAGADEHRLLSDAELNVSERIRRATEIVPDRLLKDGERVDISGLSFKVIFTPGHTEGSVCYYFDKEKVLITGDTLFRYGYGRTDLPTGNESELFSSITNRLFNLPPETICYPGHGEATDIATERNNFGL